MYARTKYSESVLNSIASGIHSINEICAIINVTYQNILGTLRKLLTERYVIRHSFDRHKKRGDKYVHSLSIRERWRLYSFIHTFLIFDIYEEPIVKTSKKSFISINNFDVYEVSEEEIGVEALYIKVDNNYEEIFETLENDFAYKSYLPFLILTSENNLNLKTIKYIRVFHDYKLPIIFASEAGTEWIYRPPPSIIIKEFENSRMDFVYDILKERQPIVDSIRERIYNIEDEIKEAKSEDDIKNLRKKLKNAKADLSIESYTMKSLSVKAGFDIYEVSKALHILLKAKRIERDESSPFAIKWYVKKN
jgi:hypothetical protein